MVHVFHVPCPTTPMSKPKKKDHRNVVRKYTIRCYALRYIKSMQARGLTLQDLNSFEIKRHKAYAGPLRACSEGQYSKK